MRLNQWPIFSLTFSRFFFKTVNQLAMETRRVMRGSHSRKTAAFVRVSSHTHTHTRHHVIAAEHMHLASGELNVRVCLLQACAAYSYITIPSLSSIFTRLSLYLLTGQVALANQCLSQGKQLLDFRFISSSVFFLASFLIPLISVSFSVCFFLGHLLPPPFSHSPPSFPLLQRMLS